MLFVQTMVTSTVKSYRKTGKSVYVRVLVKSYDSQSAYTDKKAYTKYDKESH